MRPKLSGWCNTAHMHWTAAAVAHSVGGVLHGPDVGIDNVTQDSRKIVPDGDFLFVPMVADRDGHDFIPAAVDAGAVAYLTARPVFDEGGLNTHSHEGAFPGSGAGSGRGVAVIEVADTGVALAALGRAARDRLDSATVIGVTGSVGKTTTKDLLVSVLSTGLVSHANTRSFNNEIGVPLTLLGAPEDAEAVVVEMGSRGIGDVAHLCTIARPSIGVVTTVGVAHTSEFGDVESVARAKTELVEALPADGLAVLNAGVSLVADMASSTIAEVTTFGVVDGSGVDLSRGADGQAGIGPGTSPTPDVRAEDVVLDDDLVPTFRLVTPHGSVEVTLGARGLHLVGNALAAAAVGLHLGLSFAQVASGLATPVLSPLRMELLRVNDGPVILNDSYNANPMSTEAALRSLAALPADNRIAVLGVMAELGDRTDAEHTRIGRLAAELGIRVIAVDAPGYGGHQVADVDEAFEATTGSPPGTAILVKGSRVAGLERLVERLRSPKVAD